MKEINLTSTFTVFENLTELPKDVVDLFKKAVTTRNNAYAPYSKFQVGVAILLEDSTIVSASNQENAAYPSGMCAERVAIWNAGALHPNKKIKKIVITAKSNSTTLNRPVGPCGACRQSISEYEIKQEENIQIFFMGEVGKIIKSNSLSDLLPLSFDKTFL